MARFNEILTPLLDQIINSIAYFKPEFALITGFLLTLTGSIFIDKKWSYFSFCAISLSLISSIYFLIQQFYFEHSVQAFFGMITIDHFSIWGRLIAIISTFFIFLFLFLRYKKENKQFADLYSILLTATLGIHLMILSSDWLMLYIAIETLSISSYIMVGYFSKKKNEAEASMKYVLFGSTCSAVMLYGLSLIYGLTGETSFEVMNQIYGLSTAPSIITGIAVCMLFVGIGFKLSFFPLHVWAPDVYQGAPTPITAYLSTLPKIGAILFFTKLLMAWKSLDTPFSENLQMFVYVIAIMTMLVGNLIALTQTNVKRMMAYSSIGHTGLLLMASLFYHKENANILLFYVAIYSMMNIAVFLFIELIAQQTNSYEIASYRGLGKKFTGIFIAFTVLLISFTGLPPTAGFIGKLLIFSSAYEAFVQYQSTPILIILMVGALTSVISLFYYFKIPLNAFLREGNHVADETRFNQPLLWIGYILTAIILLLGIFPGLLLDILN